MLVHTAAIREQTSGGGGRAARGHTDSIGDGRGREGEGGRPLPHPLNDRRGEGDEPLPTCRRAGARAVKMEGAEPVAVFQAPRMEKQVLTVSRNAG